MCEVLEVSRSGYYAWCQRPPSLRSQENQKLSQQIEEIHQASRQTYGSPRIQLALQAQGLQVGRNRVIRQMHQAGAHMAAQIRWPENVLPIVQPSHSPQLKPVERLWQELRKYFKGLNFETITQLEEALFTQFNELSRQAVQSLTGYSYILDALAMQVMQ
jgi:transposase InsO family protein